MDRWIDRPIYTNRWMDTLKIARWMDRSWFEDSWKDSLIDYG